MSEGGGSGATTRILGGGAPPRAPRELLVLDDGGPTSFALPETGSVWLGRGEEADVRLVDESISRQHALLHIGRTIQIEDAGSANGTHVAGHRLAPGQRVDLQP